MNFDFSAILDKIDIDAIMNKIVDLIVQINISDVLNKIIDLVMKFVNPGA